MRRHRAKHGASRANRTKRLKTCASRGPVPAKQRACPRKNQFSTPPRLCARFPFATSAFSSQGGRNAREHALPRGLSPTKSIVILVSPVHPSNAAKPMSQTLSGAACPPSVSPEARSRRKAAPLPANRRRLRRERQGVVMPSAVDQCAGKRPCLAVVLARQLNALYVEIRTVAFHSIKIPVVGRGSSCVRHCQVVISSP